MPASATAATAVLVTVLGCVYVGSTRAFNALVGSTTLFFSSSYVACILPHLVARARGRDGVGGGAYGPFRMRGWVGIAVHRASCAYLLVWFVVYSFPYYLPTDAKSMNYSCLIWGGLTGLVGTWWLVGARKGYVGPGAAAEKVGGERGGSFANSSSADAGV